MLIRVHGPALPTGEIFDAVIVDGLWSEEDFLFSDLEINGWVLPGLVDVHTHPGTKKPGDELDEKLLKEQMLAMVQSGILAIRSPGLAGTPPDWFSNDNELPKSFNAGPWLAKPGQFISGWGRRVATSDFPAVAAAQAGVSGWCKIIVDWGIDDEPISLEVMQNIVTAVHAAGGRVAAHSQQSAGSTAAIVAGVDSLEHGMWLNPDLLDQMASNGTVLVPTLKVFQSAVDRVREKTAGPKQDWYVQGTDRHPGLIKSAFDAGVQILAGSDSADFSIVAEVLALADTGITPLEAIAAASWQAREFLGLASLKVGTAADAVIYAEDPRKNLAILAHPAWVIRAGKVARRPILG